MTGRNPYAISFGRIPRQYISRDVLIDDIIEAMDSDTPGAQAFKLTGVRGTGKTVTLSAIERALRSDRRWIIIDLRPDGNILEDLVAQLYSEVPFLAEYIDTEINLSAFGIGIDLKRQKPAASLDTALKRILTEVARKGRKVLTVIDEVRRTPALIDFIQEFQILIREDLPLFLIAAGLYEDIEDVENTDGLTFFLRAEKYDMTPLNITIIREDYKKTLKLDHDTADELARMTRGYAFAYQAFGKYMWEAEDRTISDLVLAKVDDALAGKVYDKIWSELTPKDKWFLSFIVKKESMSASEILEVTGQSHNDWSVPRKHLIEKGILDGSQRGRVSLRLPRFPEYVQTRMEESRFNG